MDGSISALETIPQALKAALAADHSSLSTHQILRLSRLVSESRRYLDLYAAKMTSLATEREAHTAAGATSMESLIAQEAGISRKAAFAQVRLARQLEMSPVLKSNMSKPGMSTQKAQIISRALESLPPTIAANDRRQVERDLAEAAPKMSIEQLRRKARRASEIIDVKIADDLENRALIAAERRQRRNATFWMARPDEAGMVKGGFEVDTLTADMLRSVLEAKSSPRQFTRDNESNGNGTNDPNTRHSSLTPENRDSQQLLGPDSHETSLPSYEVRMGQAFTDVLRHLPSDCYGNHGGVAATLMVTVSEDSLRGRTDAAGVTEHGNRVSASELRLLACGAGILPAMLNGESHVLDIGRSRRLHTSAQRMALAQRDQGCAFPGCDRPPAWCESHRINPWSSGGGTSIENGVLLCGAHHRLIHNTAWEVRLGRDQHPEFIPPHHIDPERRPQHNNRYRPLVA